MRVTFRLVNITKFPVVKISKHLPLPDVDMDEIKTLTNSNSVLLLSNCLLKIAESIERQIVTEKVKDSAVKEIDYLKEQCLSKNGKLCLMSCQVIYRLVEKGVLQPGNVLTMFMALISNST